jgi:hypothetical protein
MKKACIPREELVQRIVSVRQEMAKQDLDALFVCGDEHRKENLRCVANSWPIFGLGTP